MPPKPKKSVWRRTVSALKKAFKTKDATNSSSAQSVTSRTTLPVVTRRGPPPGSVIPRKPVPVRDPAKVESWLKNVEQKSESSQVPRN